MAVGTALLCTGGIGALADELPCGPYKLAFYEHGLLYFRDAQGHAAGIDVDVADELSRRSGCRFIGSLESRARIWDQFRRQALDLTMSAVPSAERERTLEFVPYLQDQCFLIMRAEVAARAPTRQSFVDESALTVVVVKSFRYGDYFDGWLDRLRADRRVEEASDFALAARLFLHRRADAILANSLSLGALAADGRLPDDYRIVQWDNHDKVLGTFAMSLTSVAPSHRQRLRAALESMRRDGTIEAIAERYAGRAAARRIAYGAREK